MTSSIDEPHPLSVRLLLALGLAWARDASATATAARRPRPWLGLVGIALAWTAVLLAGVRWLLAPLVLCAWWWSPSAWRWTWLIPLGAGVIGWAWVVVGAELLAFLPLPIAGLIWVALAAALAGIGAWLRAVVAYWWPEW